MMTKLKIDNRNQYIDTLRRMNPPLMTTTEAEAKRKQIRKLIHAILVDREIYK